MNKKLSQCDRILRYMNDFGSITSLDAVREFGCLRLPARISDLKKKKYDIVSEWEKSENRYGDTVSYKRYSFRKEVEK